MFKTSSVIKIQPNPVMRANIRLGFREMATSLTLTFRGEGRHSAFSADRRFRLRTGLLYTFTFVYQAFRMFPLYVQVNALPLVPKD